MSGPAAQALLRNFAAGEARLDVADAALQIGAEDDALVSHSPVALPVPASLPCRTTLACPAGLQRILAPP